MAQQAQGQAQGASPTQLGEGLLNNLDGFLARAKNFTERANEMGKPSPLLDSPVNAKPAGEAPAKLQDNQIEQVVGSLSRMFDHAIETQMVVRGATQVSGAANTLLRGQ
ncbi:hypothetical protein [Pseudomonas sp. Marseille-QA0892]